MANYKPSIIAEASEGPNDFQCVIVKRSQLACLMRCGAADEILLMALILGIAFDTRERDLVDLI